MMILEILVSASLFILIWIIQILHYPSFLFVDKTQFQSFELFHTKRITFIVAPLMILELIIGILNFHVITTGIIVLIWLSTFFIQIPCHDKLKLGYDQQIIEKLIRTNWIRTILWTAKLIFILVQFQW
jgi:hypothetical protein